MTSTLGTYSFLPWLRRGLANKIDKNDFDGNVKVRASIDIGLDIHGTKLDGNDTSVPITKPVALVGPGDIIGVDPRAIVRVEPRDWITNFEPNYLAHIEFYDEDFPWRYTPAAPDLGRGRLRPWIALVVFKAGEFEQVTDAAKRPLPCVSVADLDIFPKAEEMWAWAHVHVNRSLAANDDEFVSTDVAAIVPRLTGVLAENPDLAYSRLVCPRQLEPNTAYDAFVVPMFEAGRRAGVGIPIGDIAATASAWDKVLARPDPTLFPYYHRWYFHTGSNGDFETLVRLLVPKPVDRRVGFREMDVQHPGSTVSGVDNPDLHGILKLGGALQPPTTAPQDVFEQWDVPYPRPLQTNLARLVNLPDALQVAGHPDPVITPPLYGRWHALTDRVLIDRAGMALQPAETWVSRANLDPRYRAAAGIGTRVIQDNQDAYMDAAWGQIGDVLAAQQRIRFGQFGVLTSVAWYDGHLVPAASASTQRGLMLLAPLNKRVLHDGVTVHHNYAQSLVQPTMTSAALRRIVRPRGRLIRTLPFDAASPLDHLLAKVNDGTAAAAPPKVTPPGIVTGQAVADAAAAKDTTPVWLRWLLRFPWFALLAAVILVLLAFIVAPVTVAVVILVLVVLALVALWRIRERWRRRTTAVAAIPLGHMADGLSTLPGSPDFVIREPGDITPFSTTKGADSVEAARFKVAIAETGNLIRISAKAGLPQKYTQVDLAGIAASAVAAVAPQRTIPRRIMAEVSIPARIVGDLLVKPAASFVEPMAYPVIDVPMYEPLKGKSSELFLPNINLIEENSITLLKTNERFIESYMLGLNHEFARELLWREYPTDQRGSSFRQFWDVRGVLNTGGLEPEAFTESLRDIPPLHHWATTSHLGTNSNRYAADPTQERLVLVIRGELLKRYPNAVIYAHSACWQRKIVIAADQDVDPCQRSGPIDNTVERRLVSLTAAEEATPPPSKILTPMYEAKVDPDIYFFGFDLTVEVARGADGSHPNDNPGWFFVLKERPGEPRFGLDAGPDGAIQVWNDLSWQTLKPNAAAVNIDIAATPDTIALANPGSADEKYPQYLDDRNIVWSRNTLNAADIAYVLFQAPVLVAVHAHEMLGEGS